jgi:hypothetical protein
MSLPCHKTAIAGMPGNDITGNQVLANNKIALLNKSARKKS